MIKTAENSKIMIVKEGGQQYGYIINGNEPKWYVDPQGYYISQWKAGKKIEIISCEGLTANSIAIEYKYV